MPKQSSRSDQIDIEKCVAESGNNRFEMIIMASQRAREIKQRNQHSDRHEHLHSAVTALLEIQEGKVDQEYYKKIK